MSIKLHRLAVTSPTKQAAMLDFDGKSHLIFGPTDTGKSYVVHCLRYGLGSDQRPEDIGYSEGYTGLVLQIISDSQRKYTIYRDLITGASVVQEGYQNAPHAEGSLELSISALLLPLCNGEGKEIIVKQGVRERLSAGDLRYFSLFSEMRTLNDEAFLGKKDSNVKKRYESALSLMLSGVDDSDVLLTASAKEQSLAKGQIQAIDKDLADLKSRVPQGLTKAKAEEEYEQLSFQIDTMSQYITSHIEEIKRLKDERVRAETNLRRNREEQTVLREAAEKFILLQRKYANDIDRLRTLSTAATVFESFEHRACPLCHTDIQHQLRHNSTDESEPRTKAIMSAAAAEVDKIRVLQKGLDQALVDVNAELDAIRTQQKALEQQLIDNEEQQGIVLSPKLPKKDFDLAKISERKTNLSIIIRDHERIEQLQQQKGVLAPRAKRQKQIVHRDLAVHANKLCGFVSKLLDEWKVPDIQNVSFDDKEMDIKINQRKRISFGKGKRGIFLSAYMISLMEYALQENHPHLGFVVIDSPVVTYKHPKYGHEEALPDMVKDRFYSWLAGWGGQGQVIVLENEEPNSAPLVQITHTEFLGKESTRPGRKGFFPS